MTKLIKISILLTILAVLFSQPAMAKNRAATLIKVIHASEDPGYIDPALRHVGGELKSVFKYTAYRLISQKQLNLAFNQQGRVSLPGKRTLLVVPVDMSGGRISYQINIQKKNRSVFQTRVLLKNNSSVTIGGPRYKNGVLLFNIEGSLR